MATKTLKASGGDFTTVSAWWASLPSVFTEPEILVVSPFDLVEEPNLADKTTSSTNYAEIRAETGYAFNGTYGVGAGWRSGPSGSAAGLRWNIKHLRLIGIEIFNENPASSSATLLPYSIASGSTLKVHGCLFRETKTPGAGVSLALSVANLTLDFCNNVCVGDRRSADLRGALGIIENNIFWRRSADLGILMDAGHTLRNNYCGSTTPGNDYWNASGSATGTGSNNVSSDSTALTRYPAGSQNSVLGASVFTSITAGSEDFSPLSGTTALKDAGTTATNTSVDLLGVARPQGSAYDVGAFEYVESVGSTDATADGVTLTGTAALTPGTATGGSGAVDATAEGVTLTGTATLTPGTATGGASGSFVSSPMYSSGILQASVALDWIWYPGAIGAAPIAALVHGSGATAGDGTLTAAGLSAGSGFLLAEGIDLNGEVLVAFEYGTVT